MTLTVREANVRDSEAISAIYNQGIEDRQATLETELRTPDDRREWLLNRGPRHPVVVVENAAGVAGWASLNQFNPRPCYNNVADFSVYVERSHRGTGIGSRLLDELISLAPGIGYHKLVLAALAHNRAGMALYLRKGFRTVGFYREQGRLDGRWVDVVLMERILR